MDNLIRAKNGLPIVHVDYTRATGTITTVGEASFTGGLTVDDSNTVAASPSVVRKITDVIGYSLKGGKSQAFTVTAEPVLNKNEVYNAYLEFLKPHKEFGEKLVCTQQPPSCGEAHLVRECNGAYYWIPSHFKHEFLHLSLATSVMRGEAVSVPSFFEVTVVGFKQYIDEDGESPIYAEIEFASELFNDRGVLYLRIGDDKFEFPLAPYPETHAGAKTKTLLVAYNQGRPSIQDREGQDLFEFLNVMLMNETVEVRLDSHKPPIPSTKDRIDDLRSELEQIRLNQQGF